MAVGTQIGTYTLRRKLARGGMADIFLATRPGPTGEQLFVVKMILPERLRDPQALKLFLGEARLAQLLRHPNIVEISTLDRVDDYFYFVMEYVAGETLHAMLLRAAQRKLRLSPRHAAAIICQACQGLAYAHEMTGPDGKPLNVVHRDISPSNMMLSYDGCVKLLDFGIAVARIRRAGFPRDKALGKRGYMSPEQCRGQDIDLRSDIFSLGVVFWELLAGGSLFSTLPPGEMSTAILSGQVDRPSRYCPGLDSALEEVVMKALRVDRQQRFQSAQEMKSAILQAVPDLPGQQELGQMLRELFSAEHEQRSRRGECGQPIDLETLLFDDIDAPPSSPSAAATPAGRVSVAFHQVVPVAGHRGARCCVGPVSVGQHAVHPAGSHRPPGCRCSPPGHPAGGLLAPGSRHHHRRSAHRQDHSGNYNRPAPGPPPADHP